MCIVIFNNINIQPRSLAATIFDRYENYVLRTITTVGNVEYYKYNVADIGKKKLKQPLNHLHSLEMCHLLINIQNGEVLQNTPLSE